MLQTFGEVLGGFFSSALPSEDEGDPADEQRESVTLRTRAAFAHNYKLQRDTTLSETAEGKELTWF